MSGIADIKKLFVEDVVAHGVSKLPQTIFRDWLVKFRAPVALGNVYSDRLANRFTIGCSPTMLWTVLNGVTVPSCMGIGPRGFVQTDGDTIKFQIPQQRSCLRLVAGLLKAMQFVQFLGMEEVDWHSGSFVNNHALIGGIHFGRLTSNRVQEIMALDALYQTLLQAKVFDNAQQYARLQGDVVGRKRGFLGDIRRHLYGYEYRSFPSFLDSPFQAWLVLTLAKLAVMSSREVSNWMFVNSSPEEKIVNLLASYKGLDEDARWVHRLVVERGLIQRVKNLKDAWGLLGRKKSNIPVKIPINLPIEAEWVDKVLQLCSGEKVKARWLEPWWNLDETPGRYVNSHGTSSALHRAVWELKQQNRIVVVENSDLSAPVLVFNEIPINLTKRHEIEQILKHKISVQNLRTEASISVASRWLATDIKAEEKLKKILCLSVVGFYPAGSKRPSIVVRRKAKETTRKVLFDSKYSR